MSNDNLWLQKLVEGFDDVKERLIRIEEQVKDVRKMQEEISLLGSEVSAVKQSARSAHKRLDKMEEADKQKVDDIRFLKRAAITGAISVLGAVLTAVIVAAVKGWI